MKKPRIAIYFHVFQRNDGPPLYWRNVLENQLKTNITHLEPNGTTFQEYGAFDVHLVVDYGEDGLPIDINWTPPDDGGITAYVVSDAHLGYNYRMNKAKKFDYVFVNQKRFVDEFKKDGVKNPIFLPHAAEPQAFPKYNLISKKYDICFIGHVQDEKNYNNITRIEFLDYMYSKFPNFYFGTRQPSYLGKNMFEDAARRFCESRVVLNISIADDLNMRLFEVLSTGSFLLTNWLPTLSDLFEDGKHLVTYKTLEEAEEKTKYYLTHNGQREKIAKAGYEEFIKHHTYKHRVLKSFGIMGFDL